MQEGDILTAKEAAYVEQLEIENGELQRAALVEMSRTEVLDALLAAGMVNGKDYTKWQDANGWLVEITTASKPEIRLWSADFGPSGEGEACVPLLKIIALSKASTTEIDRLKLENADLRQQHAELVAPVGGNFSPEEAARHALIGERRALRMKGNADDRYYDTKALLEAIVKQIAMCRPVDEVGHAFLTNRAYIDAQSHLKQIEEEAES